MLDTEHTNELCCQYKARLTDSVYVAKICITRRNVWVWNVNVRSKEYVSTVDSLLITVSPKVVGPTKGNNPYNSRNALAHIQTG